MGGNRHIENSPRSAVHSPARTRNLLTAALLLLPVTALAEDFSALTKKIDAARSDYESCVNASAAYYGERLCRDVSELVPGAFGKCTDKRTAIESLVRERGDGPSERTRLLQTIRENSTDTMTAIILDRQIAVNCQPR